MNVGNPSAIQLSLCIPTYNRCALLKEALTAIYVQWCRDLTSEQASQVELVLADNCSTDETSAVVKWVSSLDGLRVISLRQTQNRGPDANILAAIQAAQGEFVYLLSDDDILLPGGLAKIFALMQEHPDAAAFCLNCKQFIHDVSEETGQNFRLAADQRIAGRDSGLLFLGTWITFISALVFRRARVADRAYEDKIGTMFLQSYVYLDVLAADPILVVTQKPFLAVRGYNSGGFNFFEAFVTQFRVLMNYAETQGFSPQAVRRVMERHLRGYLLPYTIVLRVRDSYGTFQPDFQDAAVRLRAAYPRRSPMLLLLLTVLAAPRGPLQKTHTALKGAKSAFSRVRSRHRTRP